MRSGDDEERWADLMRAAQRGDAGAHARLLGEVGGVVERYLRRRFGDSDFVEDCVQETLLAVHRARHTYQPGRPFRPWLFTIAKHKAIDQLRRQRVRDEIAQQLETLQATQRVDEYLDHAELLGRLDRKNSEALVLTKIVGMTSAEAARVCGVSEGAMKVRVFRAIRAARRLLESDEAYV